MKALRQLADKHGILLIADEVGWGCVVGSGQSMALFAAAQS